MVIGLGYKIKKKVLIGIAVSIAFLLVLSIFIPITINIDKEIKAVEIRYNDSGYCKPTTIKVKGYLGFYLIGDDVFSVAGRKDLSQQEIIKKSLDRLMHQPFSINGPFVFIIVMQKTELQIYAI